MTNLSKIKKHKKPYYFSRTELSVILSTYSARVARGDWRDYALDNSHDAALFSIYRHAHETPVLVIEKRKIRNGLNSMFLLHDRHKTLNKSSSLNSVILYLNNLPRLIYAR